MAESTILFTAKVLNDFRKMKLSRGRDPGSIIERTLDKETKDFVRYLKSRYLTSGSKSGHDFIAKRSGRLRDSTYGITTRTSNYGSTSRIVIGEGLPYTKMHVGNEGRGKRPFSTGGTFVIPFAAFRNADGSWRAPFKSPLRNVPGLFRGSRKTGLKSDTLYKVMSKGSPPTPIFKLKKTINVSQRVQIDLIGETLKPLSEFLAVHYSTGTRQ